MAGELVEKVTLRRVERTRDEGGGYHRHHTEYATVRAKIRPLYGNERVQNDRVESHSGYMVIIRHRPDVNESDSIFWHQQNRVLNIRFARRQSSRNLFLEMETDAGRSV